MNTDDVNFVDRDGNTWLFDAVWAGKSKEVKRQIEGGSDVNWVNNAGQTPLGEAVMAKGEPNLEIVEALLAGGADVNAVVNAAYGETALMMAAQMGHPEVVTALLLAGADPILTNNEGDCSADMADLATPAGQECHALIGAELAKRRAADLDRKLDQKCGSWVPPEASSSTIKTRQASSDTLTQGEQQKPTSRSRQRF